MFYLKQTNSNFSFANSRILIGFVYFGIWNSMSMSNQEVFLQQFVYDNSNVTFTVVECNKNANLSENLLFSLLKRGSQNEKPILSFIWCCVAGQHINVKIRYTTTSKSNIHSSVKQIVILVNERFVNITKSIRILQKLNW